MTPLERFHACMNYAPVDRVPNHEVGTWVQTKHRWRDEGLAVDDLHWDWFVGDAHWGMDPREYFDVRFDLVPPFEEKVLAREGDTEIIQRANGVVSRALVTGAAEGMRASMDEYLRFPVTTAEDFRALQQRYRPSSPSRYPAFWEQFQLEGWRRREHVLVLGKNCSTLGFYWRAREWMGTENLSYAWYDQPELMHEMMEFVADFTIETARPALAGGLRPDYVFLNEDMSMKNGPLLSPETFRTFILPHLRRLVAFFKSAGVRWFVVDTDGNCELLIPHLMDAGVDAIWPLERASDMDPLAIRRKFGRELRLWGGVDKRELAKGRRRSMPTCGACSRWWRTVASSRRWIIWCRQTCRGRTSSTTCSASTRSCAASASDLRPRASCPRRGPWPNSATRVAEFGQAGREAG